MPLPNDERVVALANDLLAQFDAIFGVHPGFRAAHAKGALMAGVFTPSAEAAKLSRAPHFNQPSTPVRVRFSNSTGVPMLPDNDANADPRGMAVRFVLGEHKHTDIVSHSVDAFPARDGYEFLDFLKAVKATDPANFAGSPLEAFLGSHPAALAFVQIPKPAPSSFARESYFGVTAMEFINADGASRFGRYRIVPEEGNDFLTAEQAAAKDANFLMDEIHARVAAKPAKFTLAVQLAEQGDVVDDATIHWPAEREVLTLGTLEINAVVPDDAAEQKTIIFDPIPRVDGIEASADPLLELRAAIYLVSGRRRRSA
ncbi:catalase family peroxidase [Terriglobus roseus]|uniref:Catalase-related peroxidase n=1 Tax=Terriglobus roseus TaxID=392734 RepID=A0A1G7Q2P3_9BACT|nr:catalase family peroxidase [Terriglobus roseus]SDF91880.1 catalase [Terriglobus roseus]